jgi:SAM-dependent methyltransferase
LSSFDTMIHEERGKLLAELPKGAEVFCSAGCAGRWYFDWIEEKYGPVKLHYGVELFSPRPDDLPANVRWIANSVADMEDVPSASVDLLFSGQNIEHLYREDLVGFLRESGRVVKPGGHICLDSPNRLVTQEAGYTHSQHTLELSIEDALKLIEAAGFEAETVHGIWSGRNGLRHYDDLTSITDDFDERRRDARDDPNSSFIWWIVGRKVAGARADVEQVVDSVLLRRFPPFVAGRFRSAGRRLHSFEGTDVILEVSQDEQGYVFYGPYVPLRAGEWLATFDVKFLDAAGSLWLDVASDYGRKIHGELGVAPNAIDSWQSIVVPFALEVYTEGVEARLVTNNAGAVIRFGAKLIRA